MLIIDKILLAGLIINVAASTAGDERGETRRLNGPYIRRRRPAEPSGGRGANAPPYAVSMEPLVKYSQRDPLYDKSKNNTPEFASRDDYVPDGTNNVGELIDRWGYPPPQNQQNRYRQQPQQHQHHHHHRQQQQQQHHHQPQYYEEPEPIIEIIIKESNESLPAPTTVPPPPPTKEPVHVFYVKYKKNPNATGKEGESDVIYEEPVPAIQEHESDRVEVDPEAHHTLVQPTEPPYIPPPPSTTLRTIIRPDSETYHGSGVRVTFGSLGHRLERSEHELDESASELESRTSEHAPQEYSQSRELSDGSPTPRPHHFKRQQGPYFPLPQQSPTPNLQDLTPPPPSQQFQQGPPHQGRQPNPNYSTQAIFNRGNQKPNHISLQTASPFRPSQQTPSNFQRNTQYNPNQNPINPSSPVQINFPPPTQQTLAGRQPPRYSEPLRQDFQQRPQNQQNTFEGNEARRPQFQPTLEAQIEEYQKHKLFLHQQNLRHQAQQQSEQASQAHQAQIAAHNSQQASLNPQDAQAQNNLQYQPLQPIHVQAPQNPIFQRGQQNYNNPKKEGPIIRLPFSGRDRDQLNFDLNARNKVISQNFVTPTPSFSGSLPQPSPTPDKVPFVPSPQHIPPQKQSLFIQPSQISYTQPPLQNADTDYLNKQQYHGFSQPIYKDAEFVETISPIKDIDIKSDGESGDNKVPPGNEGSHQSEQKNEYKNTQTGQTSEKVASDQVQNQPDSRPYNNITPSPAENHRYEPVYSSTTPKYRPTFTSRTSPTTLAPETTPNNLYSLGPSSTSAPQHPQEHEQENKEESEDEVEKKKANLAALPDEVPDDLREQLLSSGILSNADISILDYDKVGDIPIESLPPEALENLYGAGSEQVASVVKPDEPLSKNPVEMKVVRYDPNTKEGQGLADTYLRSDATQLDPVVLNDSRYNRYLPLKISGSNFPLPDVPQLKNRVVNSVVVLAPVDYDFIKAQEDVDRMGRTIQVEGVRFIAGDSLKTLVKDPSLNNYNTWLEKEKETPTGRQSVILLVTSPTTSEKTGKSTKMEIFMYDVGTSKVSKLRGELSSTFVEVAESNSGSEELEELAGSNQEPETSTPTAL
ncbi:hypothetical protein GE061_001647 [Apolygus lucorum]|uniref:Uncharacterized protein n=1 Tax=Apolygus lucorum TaxID=248454 RepID=A0A8S9Y7Y1_APOLU|nr:hypothetical protein GE061_001647 [Apolygus lucorum]